LFARRAFELLRTTARVVTADAATDTGINTITSGDNGWKVNPAIPPHIGIVVRTGA
jgi:hypothetical protein